MPEQGFRQRGMSHALKTMTFDFESEPINMHPPIF
jgi:hypothetical protein